MPRRAHPIVWWWGAACQNKSPQGDHSEGPYTSIRLLERNQDQHRVPLGL